MQTAPGAERLVLLKAIFLDEPHSGSLVKMTTTGVWIDSLELASSIQRALAGVGAKAVPPEKQFLKNRRVLFVPFTQIAWILADRPLD